MFAFYGSGMGFYPLSKSITIFTGIVKGICDFGLRIAELGRHRVNQLIFYTPCPMLYAFFNLHYDHVCDQGQASVDEYGSLLCVRADGCGRWRVEFPGTSDRDGHRHACASARAQ